MYDRILMRMQEAIGNQQVMLKKITVMPVLLPTIVLYST